MPGPHADCRRRPPDRLDCARRDRRPAITQRRVVGTGERVSPWSSHLNVLIFLPRWLIEEMRAGWGEATPGATRAAPGRFYGGGERRKAAARRRVRLQDPYALQRLRLVRDRLCDALAGALPQALQ